MNTGPRLNRIQSNPINPRPGWPFSALAPTHALNRGPVRVVRALDHVGNDRANRDRRNSAVEEQVADKKKLLAMIKPAKPISEMTGEELDRLAEQIVGAAEVAHKPTKE
jgi:hypothetical protein